MNNIISFEEYRNQRLLERRIIRDNIERLDEKKKSGVRGFANKIAHNRVKMILADEIEMSKQIMDGIKSGIESLDDDFEKMKEISEKQFKNNKVNDLLQILEKAKNTSWDLNSLIDEGEIDYAGFTGNVAYASVRYFGIWFFPITSMIIMKKAYNYFFNIVKNNIRKSLVMLQLNFDQFENLIITKAFQSEEYQQRKSEIEQLGVLYGELNSRLFDKEKGSLKNKNAAKREFDKAMQKIKDSLEKSKKLRTDRNNYNCLDQYNNTYTKTLETLRNYSQEDNQKQLDAIKNTMLKIAGKDEDFTAYVELLTATAEEHALKVSSAIYNRFAKLASVFSLPNQKKLIDMIQASTEAQIEEIKEKAKQDKLEKDLEDAKNELEENEKKCKEIFEEPEDCSLGILDDDNKYNDVHGDSWTFEHYDELPEDDKELMKKWFLLHPEVLKECDKSLQVSFELLNQADTDYIDILVDRVGDTMVEKKTKYDKAKIDNADDFVDVYNIIFKNKKIRTKKTIERITYAIQCFNEKLDDDSVGNKEKIVEWITMLDNFLKDIEEYLNNNKKERESKIKVGKKEVEIEIDDSEVGEVKKTISEYRKEDKNVYYIDLSKLNDDGQEKVDDLFFLYKDKDKKKKDTKKEKVVDAVFKTINDNYLSKPNSLYKDGTMTKLLNDACSKDDKKLEVDYNRWNALNELIKQLKDEREHDYPTLRKNEESVNDDSKEDDKKEKSGK